MKKLTGKAAILAAAICVAAALPSWAAITNPVAANYTLTGDETVNGSLVIPSGVTVDLNGYRLTVQGIHSGSAPILTDDEDAQYEQLEYVITSNRYVQTTYVPGTTDRAEMLVELPDNSNGFLFSTRDNNYSNAFSCYRKSGTVTRFDLGSNQSDLSVNTTANGNRYYMILHSGWSSNNDSTKGTGFVRANDASSTSFSEVQVKKTNFAPAGSSTLRASTTTTTNTPLRAMARMVAAHS